MQCEDCKWWHEAKEEDDGQCRKYAPKMIVASCGYGEMPEYSIDWAITQKDDWCGEFESK